MWELDHKESWAPKNWCFLKCGVGEDSWESLGQQEDQTSQSQRKSVLNIHWKHWYWSWSSNTLATWYEELIHLEKTLLLERLKAGGEGDKRGWDGWTASPTQWTWVWASSRSWWWTGKPGMLKSMGVTKSNKWTESRANGLFHRLWWYLARMYSAQHCVIVVKLIVATTLILLSQLLLGLPWRLSGKEYTCHCRRRRFNPWVWKIPWRRKWQLTPVFFLGKPMDRWVWQATVYGVAKEPDPVTKQQQSPKGKS